MQKNIKHGTRLLFAALSVSMACFVFTAGAFAAQGVFAPRSSGITAISDESDAQKIADAQAAANSALSGISATNATTDADILSTVNAALPDSSVTVAWDGANGFQKTAATDSAAGSITGTLALSCGSADGTVSVQLSIAKLVYHTITFDAQDGTVSPASSPTNLDGTLPGLPVPTRRDHRFEGWFTAESGGKQIFSSHVFSQSQTIYAQWIYTGTGPVTSAPDSAGTPAPPKPAQPITGTTSVTATVDADRNAFINITGSTINAAIKSAGTSVIPTDISVIINVTTSDKAVSAITVNFTKLVQAQIISNKISNVTVSVKNPAVTLHIKIAALKELYNQAKGDVRLAITPVDSTALSTAAKNAFGSRPAFTFQATDSTGTKPVANLTSSSITVTIPYTAQDAEAASGLHAAYVNSSGGVTPAENTSYDAASKTLRFDISRFGVYGVGYQADLAFGDIDEHWARSDITFVVGRSLMNGTDPNVFSPDEAMTRGMFVTVLGRLAGYNTDVAADTGFSDVPNSIYYAPYVGWAASKGIVNGTSEDAFSPELAINREEMAVMMNRYAQSFMYKLPETQEAVSFADSADISSWAVASVAQMQRAGVINGTDNNRFDPMGFATRGEIASLLHRFIKIVIDK